ncbi:GGDEF domain-containing protein [Desulfovibrio sp. OttesenSCG-928-O18]|nr:GGDEF domain-containing protein [Desulfovibrio sp. OttesenSCG-928-O18]
MTTNENLSYSILCSLGIAVLLRKGPQQYVFFGEAPPFYTALFPASADGPCASPWEHSPMLEFFLDDAERFFEQKREGALTSGIWQEDGKTEQDTAMIAVATTFGETQVIIIRMLHEDYRERVGVLRKAREQLLENRELTQNLEMFKEKARFDGLTKIFNKGTFSELLLDEIKRSQVLNYPLSLLILDIDDFKKVNDTYGHLAGDRVLRSLGDRLTASLRRNDIVARFGGEEFVVLVTHETRDQAMGIGEKLRESIATMELKDLPHITVSMGCTSYIPGETADSFVERADLGLYDAKASGKNRVCAR